MKYKLKIKILNRAWNKSKLTLSKEQIVRMKKLSN